MGFLVNLTRSGIDFTNPEGGPLFRAALLNRFNCVMHSFSADFQFGFDPQVGPLPPVTEGFWEVGIVQNVLFEKVYFEYHDGAIFRNDFPEQILDSTAAVHSPFYTDPVYLPPEEFRSPYTMRTSHISLPLVVPVRDIFYTSMGLGELLDPWDPSGISIRESDSFLHVNLYDRPSYGAKLRWNGSVIKTAERIISFQIWLVAKNGSQVYYLAHIEPFSLIFWLTTEPPPSDQLSIHPPVRFDFGYYGRSGIVHRVSHSSTATTQPGIRSRLGDGGRQAVLSGETANERGMRWLGDNDLIP